MQTHTLKQFLIGTSLVLATSLALAGPGNGNPGEHLAERLDLSESQRAELTELFEQQREPMRESIRAILTPEQAERFEQMQARHGQGERSHMGRHDHKGMADSGRGMRGPGKGPGFDGIDLSEEQRAELKDLHEGHRPEMQALREDHREQMQEILTEEQYEQLKSRYAGRGRGKH